MRRVFVYEYLSAGGMDGSAEPVTAELTGQGEAMRDAMLRDLHDCGDVQVTPATRALRREGESPEGFVRRLAAAHDAAWVVAPEGGGVLLALARAVAAPRWLGCTPEAIALASSKRATVTRCAAHGIATPLAFMQSPRWVVKPDDGAGALDTRVHAAYERACADRDARPQGAWLEPWVEGEALSALLLGTRAGVEVLTVNRQRIAVDADGQLHFDGVEVDAIRDGRRTSVVHFAQRVAAALPGLAGVVGIDLVWHAARGPVLIEVNPRLTSAYVGASAALGRNIAAALLAAQGEDVAHA